MKAYRFSPSPTGRLHLGSARTALISYVMSRKTNSKFYYRIEDTDAARSTKEFEDEITESMSWLGIHSESEVIRQSDQESSGVYRDIAKALIANGLAYYCQCSKKDLQNMKGAQLAQKRPLGYEGTCRARGHDKGVLRLNIGAVRMYLEPNEFGGGKDLRFADNVYGDRHVDIRDLRDIVLLRTNGTSTYLMANTVDDTITGITNIVRGADILPQTAIQILLRRVITAVLDLDTPIPSYTHVPLVLGENGEKLSKRAPTTKSIKELKEMGILPDAITQFILSIGNNSVPRDKALTLDEIVEVYDEKHNAKNNVAFSFHLLLHINKLHIRRMASSYWSHHESVVDICKYRFKTLEEVTRDIQLSHDIISTHKKALQVLKDSDFNPEDCRKFRDTHLDGESSMSLSRLYTLSI